MLRVGYALNYHSTKDRSISDSIGLAIDQGANALQIFLSHPENSSSGGRLKPIDIKTINQIRFTVVVHGKYTLNFCRPQVSWMTNALRADLEMADMINADVVIHQGKNLAELNLSRESALLNYVNGILEVLKSCGHLHNRILLENSCHQGQELGYTIEELAEIWTLFKRLAPDSLGRLGFCLDLCHLFVAGSCDLRSGPQTRAMLDQFDKLIGLDNLRLIHFNDSNCPFGGCNDSHHDISAGYIGNPELQGGLDGFREIVREAYERGIPMILETGAGSIAIEDQISLVRSMKPQN